MQSSQLQRSRANTRCGGESLKRRCFLCARSSGSASCRSARWAEAISRERSTKIRPSPARIFAAASALLHRRRCKANRVVIDLLDRIGEQKGATPAQIALAWLLAQKPWIVPIPGTRKLERLDENIGALAVEFTSDDLREIDSAISTMTIQGDRYPARPAATDQSLSEEISLTTIYKFH